MNKLYGTARQVAKRGYFALRYPLDVVVLNASPSARFSLPRYYTMVASSSSKYLWFSVAKVANRSILHVLENNTDISIKGGHVLYRNARFEGYFKFALVRNPWDRLLSCYFDKIVGRKMFHEHHGKSFEEFIEYVAGLDLRTADDHLRLQACVFPIDEVDYVGRFERLHDDVTTIFSRLGIHGARLPHRNRSQHDHYSRYYDARTRELVGRIYAQDIDLFEYLFEQA